MVPFYRRNKYRAATGNGITFRPSKKVPSVATVFLIGWLVGSEPTKETSSRWAGSTYVSRNGGADEEGQIVRPGQELVLLPPSLHDEAHIEPQDERHRYRLAGVAEVITDSFEDSAGRKNIS